jgi:hypothetical protein
MLGKRNGSQNQKYGSPLQDYSYDLELEIKRKNLNAISISLQNTIDSDCFLI